MKYILIVLTIFLTGCDSGSSSSDSDTEATVPKKAQGIWEGECDVEGFNNGSFLTTQRAVYEFTASTMIRTFTVYDGNNCLGNITSETISEGQYALVEIVTTSDGLEATKATSTNQETGDEAFFLYYIDGEVLYFGDYNEESVSFTNPYYLQSNL